MKNRFANITPRSGQFLIGSIISTASVVCCLGVLFGAFLSAQPVQGAFGNHPLLFLSERQDLHLGGNRAHSNFFKVVQGDQYTYGMRTAAGDEIFDNEQFYKKIELAHKASAAAPIVVFVHGCCVSFGEQLLQANDLEKAIDTAYARSPSAPLEAGDPPLVVSYDWAAPFSYNSSLQNCYGAQNRFDKFMQHLVDLYGADKIIIVAHSLGTLMVQNYALQLEKNTDSATAPDVADQLKVAKPFPAIVFSRADVARGAFADCLPALKKNSDRLIVLSSNNDPNIYFSGMLRKVGVKFAQAATLPVKNTHLRLGQTKVARNFAATIEVYDMSSLRIGHGIPYKFIGDLLFHNLEDFDMKKGNNGLLTVHGARP